MPFVTIVVLDTKMVLHLMYCIYHQYQKTLLLQLRGDYTTPLLNNLFLTNPSNEFLSVRIEELCQSKKIAKDVNMDDLSNRLYDLHSLHEIEDFYGLSDDRSWNRLDAVSFKKT